MLATGTVNEVIESASRRGNIPNSQMTYLTTDFLAIMNEELAAYAMPILHARREDYYLEEMYFSMTSPDAYIGNVGNQDRAWMLPRWAMTSSLRDVQAVGQDGATYSLARIQPDTVPNSIGQGWYFYGNYLAFHYSNISNAPPPISIRAIYHVRPNRLGVAEDSILIERVINSGKTFLVSMASPPTSQSLTVLEQCLHSIASPYVGTNPFIGGPPTATLINASFSEYPNQFLSPSNANPVYYYFDVVDKYTWAVKQTSLRIAFMPGDYGNDDAEYPTWHHLFGIVNPFDVSNNKTLPNQGDWLVPVGISLPTYTWDIVNGQPGFEVIKRGVGAFFSPNPVSTGTNYQFPTWSQYTMSLDPSLLPVTMPVTMPTSGPPPVLASSVKEGDWLCPTGTSCVVPLPLEMHALLAQRMVVKFLEAQGDQEQLNQSRNSLSEMANQIPLLIQPRAEGKPKKLVNAAGHWRRWRW